MWHRYIASKSGYWCPKLCKNLECSVTWNTGAQRILAAVTPRMVMMVSCSAGRTGGMEVWFGFLPHCFPWLVDALQKSMPNESFQTPLRAKKIGGLVPQQYHAVDILRSILWSSGLLEVIVLVNHDSPTFGPIKWQFWRRLSYPPIFR